MASTNNEILLSPCTMQTDFDYMKVDFIEAIKDMGHGAKVLIMTDKEGDGFISCTTEISTENSGYGNYYGSVKFVNPESIVNFIIHCAGHTDIGSIGFGVKDVSETEVEIELINAKQTKH